MKFRTRNDLEGREGTRPGFTQQDMIYLRRQTDTPKTQIFSVDELEGEPEDRDYFCAVCKRKLDYIKNLEMWNCSECSSYHDTKIQDVPLKNTNEFKVTPWSELMHYPTYDEEDPNIPFIEGIDHNTMIEESLETRTQEDKRIQHLDLWNATFADAILKGALSSKKQEQREEEYAT